MSKKLAHSQWLDVLERMLENAVLDQEMDQPAAYFRRFKPLIKHPFCPKAWGNRQGS